MIGGVPKNQNLPFHLDKLLEIIANRFYYKIRSFKNIHMADFDSVHAHLLLPTKFLFKWLDWKKALISPQMEHSFGTFLISSRGSFVLYLCSVIIVISAWIPKREKKTAQWWWSSWVNCTPAFLFEAAVKSGLYL